MESKVFLPGMRKEEKKSLTKRQYSRLPASRLIRSFFITFISMKGCLSFLLLMFIVCSCKQSAIEQNFSSADSLVIHFKDEQAGIVTKTVETTEAPALRRMTQFIDAPE